MEEQTAKSLGELIDELYTTREDRLAKTKEVDAMKSRESSLKEMILDLLEASGLAKASGSLATCGVTVGEEPMVTDWEKVHSWIRIENRFDLLQRRLSAPAWRDLKSDGVLIPGTEVHTVTNVSLTKASRS